MALKVQDRCVDLREITELLLADMGAVLQIFRSAAIECSSSEYRPGRIEDCVANLGLQVCLEALSSEGSTVGMTSNEVIKTWRHAKDVAENCRQLAMETAATANPDEAYLVGLLHELYSLPVILGWTAMSPSADEAAYLGLQMAEDWALPLCIQDYFSELASSDLGANWTHMVRKAHEMASMSSKNSTLLKIRTL
jgi:HD-like signal output (HDOD) protein